MWTKLGHLSEESISYLNDYYDQRKIDIEVKDRANVKSVKCLSLDTVEDPDILGLNLEIYDLIENNSLLPKTSYILEYYENSFTDFHIDSIANEGFDSLTTITLIYKSEDLEGGYPLFRDERGAIVVLNQNVGEVISYNHGVKHGVSKVLKGTRRVLVNWYG